MAKIDEVHAVVTALIPDERGTVHVTLPAALRRLLILSRRIDAVTRRSEAREQVLIAAVEALAANATADTEAVLAAVEANLAAITELDEDLPEGEDEPEPPVNP